MKRLTTALAATLLSSGAMASATGNGLDLFVGTADAELSAAGGQLEPDGEEYGGRLRFGLPTGVFASASYERMNIEEGNVDLDIDEMHLGLGFQGDVGPNAKLSVEGQYVKIEAESDGLATFVTPEIDADFDGFGAYAGLSGQVARNASVYTRLGYLTLEDDDLDQELDGFDGTVGISVTLANNVGLFGEYRVARLEDDNDQSYDVNNARVGLTFGF